MKESFIAEFAELTRMTRAYLLDCYKSEDYLSAHPEAFLYFAGARAPEKLPPKQAAPIAPLPQAAKPPAIKPQPSVPSIQQPPPPPVQKTPPPPPTAPKAPPKPPALIEPPPKKQAASGPLTGFGLEPFPAPEPPLLDLSDIQAIYQHRFPHLPLSEHPLDDSNARIALKDDAQKRSCPQVALLLFSANPKLMAFMGNIARAIQLRWGLQAEILPAQQWEQDYGWDSLLVQPDLRLLLASDYGLQSLPGLMKHFREASKQCQHFLGSKPLLLLSDLTLYMREPHLKLALWQAISRVIGSQ